MRNRSNICLQDSLSTYKYNQDVLRTYIEHGADCLEIQVFFSFLRKCYNWSIETTTDFHLNQHEFLKEV